MSSHFDNFTDLIRPFRALWNSARVVSVAVGPPMERKSVVTRIVLQYEDPKVAQPVDQVLWLEPTHDVLIVSLNYSGNTGTNIIYTAIERHHIDIEHGSKRDRVLIRWPLPQNSPETAQTARWCDLSWSEPFKYTGPFAKNQFGEGRTCLALTGVGDRICDLMPPDLCQQVDSALRLTPPHLDGIDDFFERHLRGMRYGGSDQRAVQVVFPIPIDMKQAEDGALLVHAPQASVAGQISVVIHFKPQGPPLPLKTKNDGPDWRWELPWPAGSLTGKVSLFYAAIEICAIEIRRWPGSSTIRAVVDSYFDPEHKRLKEALLGRGNALVTKSKATETFEQACVRLMNVLGVPLVWYGAKWAHSKNDAAGLVRRKEECVIVLAECTEEKPEAKFSALEARARTLAESLEGQAKVLPVIFTRVDPADSEFARAREHGIALVGREELKHLFDMLSLPAVAEDALGYINKLTAADPSELIRFTGS